MQAVKVYTSCVVFKNNFLWFVVVSQYFHHNNIITGKLAETE